MHAEFKMAVQWHRSNSYESALTEDCALATEKLCPSVTRVCRVTKPRSNVVRISPEQDVWKACTRELFLEFVDLTYKVKLARNGTSFKFLPSSFNSKSIHAFHRLLRYCYYKCYIEECKCYIKPNIATNMFGYGW